MKQRIISSVCVLVFLIGMFLMIFPTIEIQRDGIFIACRYTDDISEYEDEISLDESYWYDEELNLSFYSFDVKKFLCFYVITMEYMEGNYCDTQFVLEEGYIHDFLEHAEIIYNSDDINVAKLIEGKSPVIENTRYVCEEYDWQIDYILDEKYETMFVFEANDLVVIQVGMPDEGPRYIAYH